MFRQAFASLLSDPETDDQFQLCLDRYGDLDGIYDLVDFYCPEPACDCQRVTLMFRDQYCRVHAVVSYGWQPREFYLPPEVRDGTCEIDALDAEFADEMIEGYLNPLETQSENAPFFLSCFIAYFRDCDLFQEWCRTRYHLFKEAIAAQHNKTATVIPFPKNNNPGL